MHKSGVLKQVRSLLRGDRNMRGEAIAAIRQSWQDWVTSLGNLVGTRKAAAITTLLVYTALRVTNAYAGIFGGALCSAYDNILDSETLTVISLVAMVGGVVLWILDDGQNKIKLWAMRVIAGVLVLFNLPVIFATLTGHGSIC